jgi:hypothetical protein
MDRTPHHKSGTVTDFPAAPLTRGAASVLRERGVCFFKNQPPVRLRLTSPLNRGAAKERQ